jgi:hypothetical protein
MAAGRETTDEFGAADHETVRWPDTVDEILGGDQVIALAYATPASGAVLTPVTNFSLRDREAGSISAVNTSVGVWKKLERIRRNPRVALAYHTRTHGFSDRPEYVLVQGTASLSDPVPDYPKTIRESWNRYGGPADPGRIWDWWLRVYALRVVISIRVERMVVWPDLSCSGEPEVLGAPLPESPPERQTPPRKGSGPRVPVGRAARRARRRPNRLLGWVGADGFPVVAPVEPRGAGPDGLVLETAHDLIPPGGRRAGLLSHSFARYAAGQHLWKHTGWLEAGADARRAVYAPHTTRGYWMPSSMFVFRLSAGAGTRRGLRSAREAGFA